MIKINNVDFKIDHIRITWGKFLVSNNGKKRKGIAPVISFYIIDKFENKNVISIETTYSDKDFLSLKIGQAVDITNFISDINYTENGVWDSLIICDYKVYIDRIDIDKYNLKLNCNYSDLDYNVNINIEEEINIDIDNFRIL